MSFNLSAYLKVFNEWSADELPGLMQAIIIILDLFDLAVKESLKTKVNFEALNGTWPYPESIALIHSFNAKRLLLISAPSKRLYLLFDYVSYALSEPAKSTSVNFPISEYPYLIIT